MWCELSWLLVLIVVHLWRKADKTLTGGINLWFLLPSRFPYKTLHKECQKTSIQSLGKQLLN